MEQSSNLFELQLDQSSINYLSETARWSRFLSIVGFIFCGLLVLGGLFPKIFLSSLSASFGEADLPPFVTIFIGSAIIICAVILFFPTLYLFNFSSKMRKAVSGNDQQTLTESLKNLKSCFKFWGILFIVYLSLYLLLLIFGVIGAIVGRHV
jgi:hypothetical protein